MEPRPFDRGNSRAAWGAQSYGHASMEPRPFDRGNPRAAGPCPVVPASFNGATAIRPWKRCHSVALRHECRPFNGATAFRPWKLAKRYSYSAGRFSFNGATAIRPWKLFVDASVRDTVNASMEPRPFDRGNAVAVDGGPVEHLPSMEPRPFDRGNLSVIEQACRQGVRLQWSHGLSTVETCSSHADCSAMLTLQWSHGLSTVETRPAQLPGQR